MQLRTAAMKKAEQERRNRDRVKLLQSGKSLRQILLDEGKTENTVDAVLRKWLEVGKITQQEFDDNQRQKPKPVDVVIELPEVYPAEIDHGDLPFEPGVFAFNGFGKPKLFLGLVWKPEMQFTINQNMKKVR